MYFKYTPARTYVTSLFGNRIHPLTGKKKFHQGVDFSSHGDRNIYAVGNGVVRLATQQAGYGNVVLIRHEIKGARFESLYAHLSKINVVVGQRVKGNDVIGLMGETGAAAGIHLHFELFSPHFSSDFKTAIDPLQYISCDEFTAIQVMLKRAGESNIAIDGYYGKDTQNAIKRFQKKHELEVDGFAGLETQKLLKIASTDIVSQPINPALTPSDQVASNHPIPPKKEESNINLTYSSPTLKKETEFSLFSKAHRQLVVNSAVSVGANKGVWEGKLNDGTLSDMDLLGLAVKYVLDSIK